MRARLLPNVQDEPRPRLARLVLLGARDVTAVVVGSGGLFGRAETCSSGVSKARFTKPSLERECSKNNRRTTSSRPRCTPKHQKHAPRTGAYSRSPTQLFTSSVYQALFFWRQKHRANPALVFRMHCSSSLPTSLEISPGASCAEILGQTFKMSHGHSGHDSCLISVFDSLFHFGKT
jgi:hypothetical protein